MSGIKTKPTSKSVESFILDVEHPTRRDDAQRLLVIFREVTGLEPVLWGDSIVGYGSYHYKYASGQEGDWPLTGFSPRKQNLSLYIMPGFDQFDSLLNQLGKHKVGKSCLYINKLADVDEQVLRELILSGFQAMKKRHGESEK